MKNKIIIIFLALIPLLLSAQQNDEKPVLSVLDFETSGIPAAEGRVITDSITSFIIETRKYRVIDRMQRQLLLNEQSFSKSGCSDESCQLEIGRMLSANHIMVGSIGLVGSKYILNIKLIDVETGETVHGDTRMYSSLDKLLEDSRLLVHSFVGTSISMEYSGSPVIRQTFFDPSGRKTFSLTTLYEYNSSKLEERGTVIITRGYNPDTAGSDALFFYWSNFRKNNSGRRAGRAGYTVSIFNSDGKEIKRSLFGALGNPTYHSDFIYDESGTMIRENSFKKGGSIAYYSIPQYDMDGNITEKTIYMPDGTKTGTFFLYGYMADGKIGSETCYSENSEIWHSLYEYADTAEDTETALIDVIAEEIVPVPAAVPSPSTPRTSSSSKPGFFTGMSPGDIFLIILMTGATAAAVIAMIILFGNAVN